MERRGAGMHWGLARSITVLSALTALALATVATADTCYQRTYSKAHMAANINQPVTMLKVFLPNIRAGNATAWATFRKDETVYSTPLTCWAPAPGAPENAWECGVECDGGTFTAWPTAGDGVLLRTNGGFLVAGTCGTDEDTRRVTDLNAVKTTYKLARTDPGDCEPEQ